MSQITPIIAVCRPFLLWLFIIVNKARVFLVKLVCFSINCEAVTHQSKGTISKLRKAFISTRFLDNPINGEIPTESFSFPKAFF